jgi:hypothetical protein
MPIIKPGDFDDARVQALLTRHLEGMHANSPLKSNPCALPTRTYERESVQPVPPS